MDDDQSDNQAAHTLSHMRHNLVKKGCCHCYHSNLTNNYVVALPLTDDIHLFGRFQCTGNFLSSIFSTDIR